MFEYDVIHKDKAGNTISLDWDGKIAVRNKKGQLVNPVDSLAVLERPTVKKAVAKYFKAQGYTDVEAPLTLLKEKARQSLILEV